MKEDVLLTIWVLNLENDTYVMDVVFITFSAREFMHTNFF